MSLKRITAPAALPVSLAEVKAHLRIEHDDDDEVLERLIQSATNHIDGAKGILSRALVDQTWELTLDRFPGREIQIPLPPLIEVVSVAYDDSDGNEQTVDSGAYTVDAINEPGWVLPALNTPWPTTFRGVNAVRIRFRSGYVDASNSPASGAIPEDIKTAIHQHVATLYEHREIALPDGSAPQVIPHGYDDLIRNYKEWAF